MSRESGTTVPSDESEPSDRGDVVTSKKSKPLRVAITGATGFVGNALASGLESECAVIALGRRYPSAVESADDVRLNVPGIVRRRCDLFSVSQTHAALVGAEIAVYLVHSMSPNARLTQGRFEDLDLLLADNFARAAAVAGVRRIIYLGGLLPTGEGASLSPHLASRLEVEKALGAHGVPVTAVRAGLVVGAEGSSLNLLVRLVERLPVMICPSWTSSRTQPIALSDVLEILEHCCFDEETAGRVCEVGGPDVLSYREMMQVTARVVGRRRPMIPVPVVTPALSELWVSLVTMTSRSLVRPLIASLEAADREVGAALQAAVRSRRGLGRRGIFEMAGAIAARPGERRAGWQSVESRDPRNTSPDVDSRAGDVLE